MVHQDSEVVAQVSARHSKRPHARKNKYVPRYYQQIGAIGWQLADEQRVRGLKAKSTLIAEEEALSGLTW